MLDDQQETADSRAFTQTPLPDAVTLTAYAELIPNGADRIMSLVERETEHRHRQESAERFPRESIETRTE